MTQPIKTINKVQRGINPKLNLKGILPTLVDNRTRISKQTVQMIRESYGQHVNVFASTVPAAVCFVEASAAEKPSLRMTKQLPPLKPPMRMPPRRY